MRLKHLKSFETMMTPLFSNAIQIKLRPRNTRPPKGFNATWRMEANSATPACLQRHHTHCTTQPPRSCECQLLLSVSSTWRVSKYLVMPMVKSRLWEAQFFQLWIVPNQNAGGNMASSTANVIQLQLPPTLGTIHSHQFCGCQLFFT